MTGKEAIHAVAMMTYDEARAQLRSSNATLSLVCQWRIYDKPGWRGLVEDLGLTGRAPQHGGQQQKRCSLPKTTYAETQQRIARNLS